MLTIERPSSWLAKQLVRRSLVYVCDNGLDGDELWVNASLYGLAHKVLPVLAQPSGGLTRPPDGRKNGRRRFCELEEPPDPFAINTDGKARPDCKGQGCGVCRQWCYEPCAILTGSVRHECGGCPLGWACRPGAPGFP